jgi:hypothetical protein
MQVLVASEINGLGTLGTLARDSIEVSFLFVFPNDGLLI